MYAEQYPKCHGKGNCCFIKEGRCTILTSTYEDEMCPFQKEFISLPPKINNVVEWERMNTGRWIACKRYMKNHDRRFYKK